MGDKRYLCLPSSLLVILLPYFKFVLGFTAPQSLITWNRAYPYLEKMLLFIFTTVIVECIAVVYLIEYFTFGYFHLVSTPSN